MPNQYTAEIRGMFAHPPAKALVPRLPTGCPLELVREPSNKYDVNAIQVFMTPSDLPESQRAEFELELAGWGRTLEDFLEIPQVMLGYVGKEWAMALAPLLDGPPARSASATFSVSGAGKPQAEITVE